MSTATLPNLLPSDVTPTAPKLASWHFAMVNDRVRNDAIERSIAALDLAGRTVVEIGAGTGLVALLFARHGAARVITCEMNPHLAATARAIIDATPYADRIVVVEGSSTAAIDHGLIPGEPDVIFTETLDCGVVGEGFMTIADDVRRLAGPHTVVMPGEVRQFATLVESPSLDELNRVGSACGFDLTRLNAYSTPTYFPVHTRLHAHRCLTAPTEVRRYRYTDGAPPHPALVPTVGTGTIHGVTSWFEADFGAELVTNHPARPSHWHQAFHPLREPLTTAHGELVSISIDDRGHATVAVRT